MQADSVGQSQFAVHRCEAAKKLCERAVLVKAVMEVWGSAETIREAVANAEAPRVLVCASLACWSTLRPPVDQSVLGMRGWGCLGNRGGRSGMEWGPFGAKTRTNWASEPAAEFLVLRDCGLALRAQHLTCGQGTQWFCQTTPTGLHECPV